MEAENNPQVDKAEVYNNAVTEDADPDPEFLIKSIAEQGYTLATSLSDLIDNSIAAKANKIEIVVGFDSEPFKLFLADNGNGMTEKELKINMQFPSSSPASKRIGSDLGRFGLGMKTASFSQTRRFTVLSRKKGATVYAGRTWDVDYLTTKKKWKILVTTEKEINALIDEYRFLSENFMKTFDDFIPNTIVVWQGLYKYEQFLSQENKKHAVQQELNEITNEYLSVVFHRFMQKTNTPLMIRVNNQRVEPFDPFPKAELDFRAIEPKHKIIKSDSLSLTGFVLPARSLKESKNGISIWTTCSKSLMDMEGIYVYRSDRLIRFGGWNGIIKKTPRLQLARLMVEVGNGIDDIIHLNVSKSQITIPYETKQALLKCLAELKLEAEKEYLSTTITDERVRLADHNNFQIFIKQSTNKGSLIRLNENFPLLSDLRSRLKKSENMQLSVLFRVFHTAINKMKFGDDYPSIKSIIDEGENSEGENLYAIRDLITAGMAKEEIIKHFLPLIGYEINDLPQSIKHLLSHEQ
ncbi:ATP-binding protein [Limnovirga soli]|uniref:ATP-binding protein n=1 Tax=Limnovirga soli TaxID=2656915 RepID=A0A8J8JW33_9BACT|nr:ATP-binding protein [Limnovirga soli]NNV57304.1 ATP-binding protein [Limnovirga soli]